MNFKEELEQKVQRINEVIKSYLPREEGFQKTLMEAMNYSMLSGGKRLRPLLMQETYRMFGGTERVVEPFMAAMEMIHTHSLIHDDLPALDNDEYRRGRKTTHVVYGEAMAILAGDALLNYAYETAAMSFSMDEDRKRTTEAFRILTKKTGVYGMLGGQCVDVQSEGQAVSKEKLDFIYRLKTSALIEASMMVGAVLGGATKEQVSIVEKAARDVGLAFQIQDDILDVVSTMEVLGKPVFSDEENQKTTYVTIEGIEKAGKEVEEISGRALEALDSLGFTNPFLRELIQSLVHREK
ncbi:MAG TPA: polyprenyl synthetase family protein [Candidatus Limivivens merdigallinarum]|uniref:Farnesyl diphosphate synthase n=1 Tax=Candidatus Limivivens merdigallinarum TaxID=2840859 RepID=A0A9D1D2U6_9FIRM|nr:polyprenyl synthetase family protein [Candidatus Limivivens merdigallinarum]